MHSSSCDCLLTMLEPLPCKFPPCNCEKCQRLRAEGKPEPFLCKKTDDDCDNLGRSQCDVTMPLAAVDERTANGFFSRFSYNFHPENIYSVLFDIVGTIAFIIMATFTFWFVISVNLKNLILTIYHSGRKIQVLTIVLLALLFTCIVFHAISGHKIKRQQRETAKNHPNPQSPVSAPVNNTSINSRAKVVSCSPSNASLKCLSCLGKRKSCHQCPSLSNSECEINHTSDNSQQKDSNHRQSGGANSCNGCNGNLKKSASESLCDLCAKKFGSKTIISDDEARKIFQRSQFYAIPTEWKSPPSLIVFIVDYISNLFSD